jgi:acyl carrier protein
VCDQTVLIDASRLIGDIPCPHCGQLLWWYQDSRSGEWRLGTDPLECVRPLIAEQLGVDAEKVTRSTAFFEDIGADTLDVVELIMDLEAALNITIPDRVAEKIRTVGDLLDYVEQCRAGRAAD